jgi:hypothetical protein
VWSRVLPVVCLILVHSSDGGSLWVESEAITVLKPLLSKHQDHLARGTRTLVYTAGKVFGVRESEEDIERMIKSCGKGS